MKDYIIITDSGCDLSQELAEKLNVQVVPMGVSIQEKNYKHYIDCRELNITDFYQKLRDGHMGTTSCVNTMDVMDTMKEYLDKNMDVLYLSFSGGMSSSYQSSVLATRQLEEDYPNSKIIVADTLSGSVGLGMLTYLAAKEKEKGKTIEEVEEFIKNKALNICHYFMVSDLKYIQKSGRISNTSAIVGCILNVKPIFKLSDEGKVVLSEKVRGTKAAVRQMIEHVEETCTNKDLFFICHADASDHIELLKEKLLEKYPNAEIHLSNVGPVIGNNTGPGTIAVIFEGSER